MESATAQLKPAPDSARLRRNDAAADYPPPSMESLAAMRDEVRRERLIDMEGRLKRYRMITFGILGLALLALGPRLGGGWLAPRVVAMAGFVVADHYLERSSRPEAWIAAAWALSPALIFGGVVSTGGPESPVVMWLAIPAVTLGARFEPRGIAIGTAYILALLLIATVGVDPSGTFENYPAIVASISLLASVVLLSSALAESDRAFRRRSTLDPLTGSFNRNALDQRRGRGGRPGDRPAPLRRDPRAPPRRSPGHRQHRHRGLGARRPRHRRDGRPCRRRALRRQGGRARQGLHRQRRRRGRQPRARLNGAQAGWGSGSLAVLSRLSLSAIKGKASVEMIAAPTSDAAVEECMCPSPTAIAVIATTSGS
jgi:hypothetical protein